jgi:integrase
MNTSIKAVLYKSKKLSNGNYPVMLRITKDRKSKYISTGISCSEELWDEKLNTIKKSHPHYKEAKMLIAKKTLDAEKLIYDLENDDKNLSAYEIKGKLKKGKVNNFLLFDYFDTVVERMIKSGQIKNAEIYKDTRRNLTYFTASKKVHFSDVDVTFLNHFEEFLKTNGKGPNTIYLYLRTFRALLNKAIKEEVCNEKYYPFKKFSLSKYSNIKTEKRAIAKEEIIKILSLQPKTENIILARNIFLFSYYCRGMNFTDMTLLKWKDIYDNRVNYRRKKTNEQFSIELLPPVLEILNYYKDVENNHSGYVFPIILENHKSAQAIFNRKVKMLKEVNRGLKAVGKLAGIQTKLTTYVARHSYATVLRKNGISTSVISQAMGHDSEKTTQIYLESFGNNILDEASKVIL